MWRVDFFILVLVKFSTSSAFGEFYSEIWITLLWKRWSDDANDTCLKILSISFIIIILKQQITIDKNRNLHYAKTWNKNLMKNPSMVNQKDKFHLIFLFIRHFWSLNFLTDFLSLAFLHDFWLFFLFFFVISRFADFFFKPISSIYLT